MKYYQCRLRRYLENTIAYIETIMWLEKKYAVDQVPFQIEDKDGTWQTNWEVIDVYFYSVIKDDNCNTQRRVKDV